MFTLVDGVAALLYRSAPQQQAAQRYESLVDDRGALAAALLMELALQDRVRLSHARGDPARFVAREQQRATRRRASYLPPVGAALCIALVISFFFQILLNDGGESLAAFFWSLGFIVGLPGLTLLVMLARERGMLALLVRDPKPTGDRLLDTMLGDLAHTPARPAAVWLHPRLGAQTVRTLTPPVLVARLEAAGLAKPVYHPTKTRPLLLGATVDRNHSAWVQMRDGLHDFLAAGERGDARITGLALAMALHDLDQSEHVDDQPRGLLQLFTPLERPAALERLRAVAQGLAPVAEPLDRERYLTCLGIYLAARDARDPDLSRE